MRQIFFHVGMPKTGTSFVQKMLVENEAALIRAGLGTRPFLEPPHGDTRRLRRLLCAGGFAEAAEAMAAAPGERLLVSSEHFIDLVHDLAFARAIRDAFARRFEIRIIVFLRRQDALRESLYAQLVKSWYEGPAGHFEHFDLDHAGRLARLESVFGRENMIVRLYRDGGHGGGHDRGRPNDVFGEILAATGTRLPPGGLAAVERQNVSLSRRKLLFLAGVPKPDPNVQDLADVMTAVVTRTRAIRDDGGRFLLSPEARRALVAEHLAGNRAAVARYRIPDAEDLLRLPGLDPSWRPPAPITPAEMARVHAEALAHLARRHPNRFGLAMAKKIAQAAPVMAWRRFVRPLPPRPAVPPRGDLMPEGGFRPAPAPGNAVPAETASRPLRAARG